MTPTLPPTDPTTGIHTPPAVPSDPPAEVGEEFDPGFLARLRELDWLDGESDAGRLRPFRDEYVIRANRTILAHGRNLGDAYTEAEQKADELGIPHGLLANYFVPGS